MQISEINIITIDNNCTFVNNRSGAVSPPYDHDTAVTVSCIIDILLYWILTACVEVVTIYKRMVCLGGRERMA